MKNGGLKKKEKVCATINLTLHKGVLYVIMINLKINIGLWGFPLRILFVCHGVMYQQLSAWCLHGIHIDKHNEFFIKEVTSEDDDTLDIPEDGTSSDLGIPGITGRQLAEILVRPGSKRIVL